MNLCSYKRIFVQLLCGNSNTITSKNKIVTIDAFYSLKIAKMRLRLKLRPIHTERVHVRLCLLRDAHALKIEHRSTDVDALGVNGSLY